MLLKHPDLARRGVPPGRPIVVIGGGASGVLMAVHLLRSDPELHVTIVERRRLLGCGVAYGTTDANHLLNTRVSSMSAFADDPDHFRRWLCEAGEQGASPFAFVRRELYGRYMADILTPWRDSGRLSCRQTECLRVHEDEGGVRAYLSDGGVLAAEAAVLATGHLLPEPESAAEDVLTQPWSNAPPPHEHGRILIVGSGLTMVDQVLSLLAAGHRGEILVVSRRGLVPRVHADVAPAGIPESELPTDGRILSLMRWLRERVATHVASGGDWRSVVDGLRPHVQYLWQTLPTAERARFLRHACACWEVHRHRMPPHSGGALTAAQLAGQLRFKRGAFTEAQRVDADGILARIRVPGRSDEAISVARVIDCRGIRRDPEAHARPLLKDLLRSGRARIDPLRLGIEVDPQCRVLRSDGRASDRLFAIGPVSRTAFWEITAIPDIREQVTRLAAGLARAER